MTGFINWAYSKISSAVSIVKESVTEIVAAGSYLLSIIPFAQLKAVSLSFLQGSFRVLDPRGVIKALSPGVKSLLAHSFKENVIFYMGFVLLYEDLVKPGLRMLPYVDFEDTCVEQSLTVLLSLHLMLRAKHVLLDAALNHASLAKLVTQENPNNEHFKTCGHGKVAAAKANIAGAIYYVASLIEAYLVYAVCGEYISLPIYMLAYGQGFLESKLGSADNCTDHRYETLSKTNSFSLGMGASFVVSQRVLTFLISYLTRIDSDLLEKPVFNFLFPYFLISSLTMEKPLPKDNFSLDVFFISRYVSDYVLKRTIELIAPYLSNQDTQGSLIKNLQKVSNSSLGNFIKKIMLEKDLHSLDAIVTRPSVNRWIRLNKKEVQDVLSWIKWAHSIRHIPLARQFSSALRGYLPDFLISKKSKMLLKLLFLKNLGSILDAINMLILSASVREIEPLKINATFHVDKKLTEYCADVYDPHPDSAVAAEPIEQWQIIKRQRECAGDAIDVKEEARVSMSDTSEVEWVDYVSDEGSSSESEEEAASTSAGILEDRNSSTQEVISALRRNSIFIYENSLIKASADVKVPRVLQYHGS